MSSLLLIILSAVLVSMIAAMDEGKWRPFENVAGVYRNAAGLAKAHVFCVPVICGLTWLLSYRVLQPLEVPYLRTPAFAAMVLVAVPITEVLMRRTSILLPARPGFALVLCANGALLGIALSSEARAATLGQALILSVGATALFAVLLLCAATLYERLRYADVPAPFRNAPILLITAGMMALAFMGFSGLIQE
jgi:Na+-translocating ferredoxin:NAD+ oxidoreductase subunit A